MNILLVEDEKNLSDALVHILKKEKYTVDAAYDGEQGLEMGLSGRYDVILLDIMMPKMNGYAVLENLRKEGVSTPVLILTARNLTSEKVKGLDLAQTTTWLSRFLPANCLPVSARCFAERRTSSTPTSFLTAISR